MTFAEAVEVLKGGGRVSREGWGNRFMRAPVLQVGSGGRIDSDWSDVAADADWSPHIDDFTATDWYVVPLSGA